MVRWCWPGNLPVSGRPANLDYSRERTCSRCGGGIWTFVSLLSSFSFSLVDGPV